MRKVFGFVSALAGGFLLYWAFKLGRVLLLLEDKSFDGTMIAIAVVTALIGLGLMWLGWILFSDPIKPPAPRQPPEAQQP